FARPSSRWSRRVRVMVRSCSCCCSYCVFVLSDKRIGVEKVLGALVTGLAQGAMIALVSLGYSMVYGVLKLINFAHSEVFMMAAYIGLFVIMAIGGEQTQHPLVAVASGTIVAMFAVS